MVSGRAGGRLQALSQPVSQQVANAMRAPDRLIARTRLPLATATASIIGQKRVSEMRGKERGREGEEGEEGGGGKRRQDTRRLEEGTASMIGDRPNGKKDDTMLEGEEEEEEEVGGKLHPDTYDDAEFYQQLLREFLDSSRLEGLGLAAAHSARRAQGRTRKKVDRRASKGRKIRYETMAPLMNFMAVEERERPEMTERLFAGLFGGSQQKGGKKEGP